MRDDTRNGMKEGEAASKEKASSQSEPEEEAEYDYFDIRFFASLDRTRIIKCITHSHDRRTEREIDRRPARNFQRHRSLRERLLRPYGHYQEQQQSNSFVESYIDTEFYPWTYFHGFYSQERGS